jgi:hypothetical protein
LELREVYKKLNVMSYSRSQGSFHSETLEQYIVGSIIDIESSKMIGCDYRAIGFYLTAEEGWSLQEKFKTNNFKKLSCEFIQKFNGISIW